MQVLSFSIRSFSMCSPPSGSVTCFNAARLASWQDNVDEQSWRPNDDFMPKRKLRRLSRMSKMALFTAHHASEKAHNLTIGPPIFCSRYGEFKHTSDVLTAIHDKDLVSPMDFSYAVHNTGQGLFSILYKDTRPATALSARQNILEEALVKAYVQLRNGDKAVLVVYQEDVLPEIFKEVAGEHIVPLSFALVLSESKNDDANKLTLSFQPKRFEGDIIKYNEHEQNIARLFLNGGGVATLKSKRTQWDWRYETL